MRVDIVPSFLALVCSALASTAISSSIGNGTYLALAKKKSSNSSTSSSTVKTSSTDHIGNLVAQGIGLTTSPTPGSTASVVSQSSPFRSQPGPALNVSTPKLSTTNTIFAPHRLLQTGTTTAPACLATPPYPVAEGVLTEDGEILTATKYNNGEIHVGGQTVYPPGVTSVPLCSNSSLSPSMTQNGTSANSTAAPTCLSTSLYPIAFGLVTADGVVATATKMNNGEIIVANTTVYPDGVTSLPPCPTPTQPPFNGTEDQCWSKWNSWYNSGLVNKTITSAGVDYSLSLTETDTVTTVQQAQSAFTSTITFEGTFTTTIIDGKFTLTTETITTDIASTTVQVAQSSFSEVTTFTITRDPVFVSTYTTITNPGPTPNCVLPSSVSQCQASWDSWAAQELATTEFISTPRCTQAAITGETCSSLVNAYISSVNPGLDYFVAGGDVYSEGYYYQGATSPGGFVWPSEKTIGIGCTVGCGGCAVTGNSVKLLYWPPATAHDAASTLVTLGTTLTSPTLYISYSEIYASDHCKGVGATHYNTIVPIARPNQLSSLYAIPYYNNGQERDFALNPVKYLTAPFTIADLNSTPVPKSIYTSQPFCASYAAESSALIFSTDASGYVDLVGWTCPTTRPYEPILVPPQSAYGNIDPAWSTCRGALEGVYDPPQALKPAAAEASVTLPGAGSPSATPAQNPSPDQPSPTAVDPEPDHVSSAASPKAPSPVQPTENNQPAPAGPTLPADSPDPAPSPNSPAAQSPTPAQNPAPAQNPTPAQSRNSPNDNNPAPGQSVGRPVNNDPPNNTPQPIATIGGQTIVADPSSSGHVIVISPGGSPATLQPGQSTVVGDTPVSVGTGVVVFDGSTAELPPATPTPGSPAAVTLPYGQVVTAAAGQPLVINGQTLTPGGPALTTSGETLSMASNGMVIDGTTMPFADKDIIAPFTASGSTYTATEDLNHLGTWVIDGTTLTAGGPAITFHGQTLSAASSGLLVDGSNVPLTTGTPTSTSSSAKTGESPAGSAPAAVTGAASDVRVELRGTVPIVLLWLGLLPLL